MLVYIVLVHFLLKLNIFLVNSVDLLSELFMLSLESLDLLVEGLDLLGLLAVHVGLVPQLALQRNELLGLRHHLYEGFLVGVVLAWFSF